MGILRYVPHSMQKHHFPDNSLVRPAGIAKVTAEWFHGEWLHSFIQHIYMIISKE